LIYGKENFSLRSNGLSKIVVPKAQLMARRSKRTRPASQPDKSDVVTSVSNKKRSRKRKRKRKRSARRSADDPYALILLADEEMEAHRTAQAERLIEAAFVLYDKWTK
jgi:hypothetical protein